MFFFILITYLVDFVLILLGEILSWSLMGVKGLNDAVFHCFFNLYLVKISFLVGLMFPYVASFA